MSRTFLCVLLFAVLALGSPFGARGQEPGSFRLDPKTGELADGKRDYTHPAAAEILRLALTDWMTNPELKDVAYGYLTAPDDGPKPKLERLLIDERYVPKGFDLKIEGVTVEKFDRSKRNLKKGELAIRIDRFEPAKDGTVEVEFVHTGHGFIGGAWVTYTARKADGKWSVEFAKCFDP